MVVIGASAGGVEALSRLVRNLPADFPAAVCIVLHIAPSSPSLLPHILGRQRTLPVRSAEEGERYEPGTVYVAPPDHHLVIGEGGILRVVHGPRENRHRPAVDPLFRSAALHFGNRAVGVILSGTLDDGTAGLRAIKQRGGIAVVQDPKDALYPGMPLNAIEHVHVDHVLPLELIALKLVEIVSQEPPRYPPDERDDDLIAETRIASLEADALQDDDRPGKPSPFSCPDCGGVLWELAEGDYVRFRCRVGHAYSPETMIGAQDDVLEEALWTAMKTLEESARLSAQLARNESQRGHDWMARRFQDKERDARERVEVIRRFLLRGETHVSSEEQAVSGHRG